MQLNQLDTNTLNHLATGQRAMIDIMSGADTVNGVEQETVTSGALSTTTPISLLSITGTQAFTLANGQMVGQRKYIQCAVAASTPAGTLTIATPSAVTGQVCSATFYFDTVNQGIELVWNGSAWVAARVDRAGGVANNVVVGTTVLTGFNMWFNYFLSVTGTVSSTTTKGIPNGSAIGEIIRVAVSTAASTPSGTIACTGTSLVGVAATTIGTASATSQYVTLRWDGVAWHVLSAATLTLT